MSRDLWFIHYTVVIPPPVARPSGSPLWHLLTPPRTQVLIVGPYEGWEAVTKRLELLRQDSVVDAFLDRAPAAKSVAVPVHSYRGTAQ